MKKEPKKQQRPPMTELNPTLHRRGQLAAIAELRWRMFVNSLRSTRGKMELASRIIVTLAFAFGGLGGAFGMGAAAFYFVSQGKPEFLALLLWPVLFFWQIFPVMATAFTNNPDSSDLLRFPLNYSSYFLIRLAYGVFDPATALGSLWLLAIALGIGFALPVLFPWAMLVLVVFALFNILFMQMVFAWIERWLAQRRTREILSVLFFVLLLSFQLIGPIMGRTGRRSRPEVRHIIDLLAPVQEVLPPGLAAGAIARAAHLQFLMSFGSLVLLSTLALCIALLLHLRLRRQYVGENLSESAAPVTIEKARGLRLGWNLPLFSQSVAAVLEKEFRYLSRSGPMLLTLVMPIFMLVIFRLGPMNPTRQSGGFLARMPNMAFPAAAGYALLMLTNLVYNNFGGDAAGIQFFYASPVRFRHIVLAKNLAHAGILVFDIALSWLVVNYLYGRPMLDITIATLAGLLFAAPLNFTAGNLLSLYSPKKLDFSTFGRQRASQLTVLVSLGVQIVVAGIAVGTFVIARQRQNFWIAAVAFAALAVISFSIYGVVLRHLDRIALLRREALIAELCRA
jgi:ABC-2 type transport system permease protein